MNGYTLLSGYSAAAGQQYPWIGGMRVRNGRVEGLLVAVQNNQQLAQQILSSLR
jgi:hypothetical protein